MRAILLSLVACLYQGCFFYGIPQDNDAGLSLSASPLPWTTSMPSDFLVSINGRDLAGGTREELETLLNEKKPLELLDANGIAVDIHSDIHFYDDVYPIAFRIDVSSALPLEHGWYHVMITRELGAHVSFADPTLRKTQDSYDIPYRVGSEPLLVSVSSCGGAEPSIVIDFSEEIRFSNTPGVGIEIVMDGEQNVRSCSLIRQAPGPLTRVVLSCGAVAGSFRMSVVGVSSLGGIPLRAAGSTVDGFSRAVVFPATFDECATWFAFDS